MPSVEPESVSSRHTICVRSEREGLPWINLLSILECVLPIRFRFAKRSDVGAAAEIVFEHEAHGGEISEGVAVSSFAIPVFQLSSAGLGTTEIAVKFADHPEVPFPFRNRSFRTKTLTAPQSLSLRDNEEVLANTDSGPLWTVANRGGAKHFRSALTLPAVPAEGSLLDVLNGDRFLELLPFIHWVRELCTSTAYQEPPLRACFIFDDPNLHWPRYGRVDFGKIAAHAAMENYRVSFATIPLDTWFTHEATAELFKAHADRLSLLVHGNDHTRNELARTLPPARRAALLRQAIRRVERFEYNSGLRVDRVMVPPHGACSEEMLADLPTCGFEAACISHGSLRAHNKSSLWTKTLGYAPSELIQGCPVLPRWGFANSSESTVLLAAFLRQPIVLRGHHNDLKGGLEVLENFAGIVNGLGDVVWSGMTGLSRLNYSWRMDGSTMRVKPIGRILNVHVPEEAETLLIESVPGQNADAWNVAKANEVAVKVRCEEDLPLSVPTKRSITLEMVAPSLAVCERNGQALPITPFVRRLLTEGRDRLVGAFGR